MYVPDADETYRRALEAEGISSRGDVPVEAAGDLVADSGLNGIGIPILHASRALVDATNNLRTLSPPCRE
jgi:hypothetical protein